MYTSRLGISLNFVVHDKQREIENRDRFDPRESCGSCQAIFSRIQAAITAWKPVGRRPIPSWNLLPPLTPEGYCRPTNYL